MVLLPRDDFEIVLLTLPAALRRKLQGVVTHSEKGVLFDDDVASDVYTSMMDYVVLHGYDKDYILTPSGEELENIALSIFDQSGGNL